MELDGTPRRLIQYSLKADNHQVGEVKVLDEYKL